MPVTPGERSFGCTLLYPYLAQGLMLGRPKSLEDLLRYACDLPSLELADGRKAQVGGPYRYRM